MMAKDIPVREMIIKDKSKAVFAISLVEFPAIEEDWVALNSMPIKLATVNEDQHILMGAALVPDKNIYREDPKTGEPFYIFFSKDTVKESSELYLKNYRQSETTVEHKVDVQGVTLVESWIIEDTKKDKSAIHNLNLPVGTWMVSLKVDNEEIWNDYVKTGKLKGFSIEGAFANKAELSKQLNTNKMSKPNLLERFKTFLGEIEKDEVTLAEFVTEDGAVTLVADSIEAGQPIFVKGEGDAENVPAPDGSYTLEDSTVVTVKDGMIETVEAGSTEAEKTEEELATEQAAAEQLAAEEVATLAKQTETSSKLDEIHEMLTKQSKTVTLTKEDVLEIVKGELKDLPTKLGKIGAPIENKIKPATSAEMANMSTSERVNYLANN